MKRREALISLFGAAGAASATPGFAQEASVLAMEELMRSHGIEPAPGEAAQVRAFLFSFGSRHHPDPREEPAVTFDPEAGP